MKPQPFIVRYLSRPVLAAWTIAWISLLVAIVGLLISGHDRAASLVSAIGTVIIAGGFGCYTLWHWTTHPW